MAFISQADELIKSGTTEIENKFITKYLPVLDAQAVKVYLFALYVCRGGLSYTAEDFAQKLGMTVEEITGLFEYLEEFELAAVTCRSPFEVKLLGARNEYGSPKKLKPEKYASFTRAVQDVITGRMISTNEFMDYFYLMDEYSIEQNAMLMIINYCVNLKGNDIRAAYIKKVVKSFAEEGATTAGKVEEKLSSYTSSTPSLVKIFSAVPINRKPDVDDNALYEKWTGELGFTDEAIISAAKYFKAKSTERIDAALEELYKNRKFDVKEIEDYCRERNSLYAVARDVAKALGVYMQDASPYVEKYVGAWRDMGFDGETLLMIADYCFMQGRNTFERMDDYVRTLWSEGVITCKAVTDKLERIAADDKFIKQLLTRCGLTRKIIDYDRQCLARWREWNFSDETLLAAADSAQGKNNPVAYMNAVLSSWKAEGITAPPARDAAAVSGGESSRAIIERHYYDLRAAAQARADRALAKAMKDERYARIRKEINSLSIRQAFAEVGDAARAEELSRRIATLKKEAGKVLAELGLEESDFTPKYKCELCRDTGYDASGRQCRCLKKFIEANNL